MTRTKNPEPRTKTDPLRHLTLPDTEVRFLERERPGLVVRDGEAWLIGQPAGAAIDLQYEFSGREAFARRFPAMMLRLLPTVDPNEAPLGLRLRLTDVTYRGDVEPVLFAEGFSLTREWLRMTLAELPESGTSGDELGPGFVLRPAGREDAGAIAELDSLSFAQPWMSPEVARTLVTQAPVFRVLEERGPLRVVGFLGLRLDAPTAGYVSDLALHPEYRRRGLGEAMMRWALGWFHSQGLRSAALQVNTDNAPAIALYGKLGFASTGSGCDYRRPIGEDEPRT